MLYHVAKKGHGQFWRQISAKVTLTTHLSTLDTAECLKKRLSKRAAYEKFLPALSSTKHKILNLQRAQFQIFVQLSNYTKMVNHLRLSNNRQLMFTTPPRANQLFFCKYIKRDLMISIFFLKVVA